MSLPSISSARRSSRDRRSRRTRRSLAQALLAVILMGPLATGDDQAGDVSPGYSFPVPANPEAGETFEQRATEEREQAESGPDFEMQLEADLPRGADPPDEDPETPEPVLDIGGALRLNYNWRDFSRADRDKAGDFGFELFRLDVDASYDKFGLSAQYRWYGPFEAIHHGYASYEISPEWEAQLGIQQVPFGILPYASHSFWFDATYYMGFEDDYDTGLKLLYDDGPWDMQLAYYKNPEYVNSARADRYSFDLVTSGDQANEETNQFNFRLAYDWEPIPCMVVNLGASVEGGQIYNQITTDMGDRFAYALHSNVDYYHWNFQLQWINYAFNPDNPAGVSDQTVQLAAFGFPFLVAADGHIANINLARKFPCESGLLDAITCYTDFSKVYPTTSDSHTSTQIVFGCLLEAKEHYYIYVDWILGQNMWFAGGPGIGLNEPSSDEWQSRLNVNFGVYF